MITNGTITFFLAAKQNKTNTLNKIKNHLEKTTGFNYSYKENEVFFEFSIDSWESAVYSLMKLSQNLGRQWIITGTIDFEFSAWTNNSSIIGVESVNIVCDNPFNHTTHQRH